MFEMHCNACGSTAVKRDAWAVWDKEKQDWILDQVFDEAFCEDCEKETSLYEEEIME